MAHIYWKIVNVVTNGEQKKIIMKNNKFYDISMSHS